MPSELNFSPLYRHRLDADGSVREMDVLWPIFHYEKTEDGGDDFRIRPFYRYVTEGPDAPDPGLHDPQPVSEHQFLWPLGRVYHSATGETLARVFPFWGYKEREDDLGLRETDWNVCYLLWGGSRADGGEDYLGLLPFWADLPDFLTYDRFQAHFFPLHVGLSKNGLESDLWLWPLIGWGSDPETGRAWHRALPLYGYAEEAGRYERYSALWPFVHWGYENLDTAHPVNRFFLFPFYGRMSGETVDSWTVLWPFFSKYELEDKIYRLDLFWPFFRYERNSIDEDLERIWLWPLFAATRTEDQRALNFLWPLIWLRQYDDPEATVTQEWVLPLYWHTHRRWKDGGDDDYVKAWPWFHRRTERDGSGEWSLLSPWPWSQGNAYGVEEAYGWLWTLAKRRYTEDSDSFHLAAHLFTTAERKGRRQTSVPFLFNYESDENGAATLRLFQFIPIPLGGGEPEQ